MGPGHKKGPDHSDSRRAFVLERKLRARLEAETSRLDFVKFMPTAGAGEQAEDGKKDEKKEEEKKLLAELIRSEWGGGGGFF